MRRAMMRLLVVLVAAALLPAGLPAAGVKIVNGIGLIDYTRPPEFRVGDWVRYQITASSLLGLKDDYTVTVLIAGEENFWGEDGFWVETWTEPRKGPPMATATLMSYAVFDDSLPSQRLELYQRKAINEIVEELPVQVITRRAAASLKSRSPFDSRMRWARDTLDEDTVSVPRGTFHCLKLRTRKGMSTSRDIGDSTEYNEAWDIRVSYLTREIPITSLAREEIENSFQQRKWQIGRSEEAPPLRYVDRSTGEARLVDFGSNLKSRMLTEAMQKSLPGRRAAQGASPAKRPAPPRGAGRKSG